MPYEDRRCLLGGAQVETASQQPGGWMGSANVWVARGRLSLTRPITAPDKGNQARRMGPLPVCLGLPCGSWTRPACARGGSGGGRPPAAHPLAANRPKRGSPRQLRWPGMDCWLPLCRHPTPGEAAMPNGKPTDRHGRDQDGPIEIQPPDFEFEKYNLHARHHCLMCGLLARLEKGQQTVVFGIWAVSQASRMTICTCLQLRLAPAPTCASQT